MKGFRIVFTSKGCNTLRVIDIDSEKDARVLFYEVLMESDNVTGALMMELDFRDCSIIAQFEGGMR